MEDISDLKDEEEEGTKREKNKPRASVECPVHFNFIFFNKAVY